MPLNTMNGPSDVSNESSGLRMAQEKGPYDLTVLPHYFAAQDLSDNEELMHPDLRRNDGQSFLIVYRAGATIYSSSIEDSFFAAHKEDASKNPSDFFADFEATALGCLEQFQYCISGSDHCTAWGSASSRVHTLPESPDIAEYLASHLEVFVLFRKMPSTMSIFSYLAMRINFIQMVPLPPRMSEICQLDGVEEHWVSLVETWFVKGFLDAIRFARNGARFSLEDLDPDPPISLKRDLLLCARVLFRDGSYTNINWLGFWATIASLVSVCIVSYTVERIHKTLRTLFKHLARLLLDLSTELPTITKTLKWSLHIGGWWGTARVLDRRPARFWRSPFSSSEPSPSRRRAWPDTDLRPVAACDRPHLSD
jgi:hypothetical protein